MRVLLDTDVVLDVVLAREPFAQESAQLLKLHQQGRIDAYNLKDYKNATLPVFSPNRFPR